MSKKFYVVCDDNCRIPGMSKEQIYELLSKNNLSARVEDGVLYLETDGVPAPDDGSGFITTLQETNAGKGISLWVGTEAEFNAIPDVEADSFLARVDANGKVYICTNDSFMALLRKTIHEDYIKVGNADLDEQTMDVLNAHDYMAGSLKQTRDADADFVGKPVQVCYQTANPPTLASGSQLAIWKDKGNGIAEIHPVSLSAIKDFVNPSMRREFNSDEDGEFVSDSYFKYYGNKSKFYTLHLTDGEYNYSYTIDFKFASTPFQNPGNSGRLFLFPANEGMFHLSFGVQTDKNGNTECVTFSLSTGSGREDHKIEHICGYY